LFPARRWADLRLLQRSADELGPERDPGRHVARELTVLVLVAGIVADVREGLDVPEILLRELRPEPARAREHGPALTVHELVEDLERAICGGEVDVRGGHVKRDSTPVGPLYSTRTLSAVAPSGSRSREANDP
jgi:hypothetical protein